MVDDLDNAGKYVEAVAEICVICVHTIELSGVNVLIDHRVI